MESCSFHLTPELKHRLVELAYRNDDGSLVPWSGQISVTEQDPEKGNVSRLPQSGERAFDQIPTSVRLHLGGVGMYSSMRDYLKLLRHILQINGMARYFFAHHLHDLYSIQPDNLFRMHCSKQRLYISYLYQR